MNPFITLDEKKQDRAPYLWNFVFLYPTGTLSMRNSPVQNCLEREIRILSTTESSQPSNLSNTPT